MKTLAQQFLAGAPALGLALLALAYLLLMLFAGTQAERVHLIRFEADGVMSVKPELVTRVWVNSAEESVSFERSATDWVRIGDSAPVGDALAKSISLAVKFMHTAEPVRVFKAREVATDAASSFGLAMPTLSIQLHGTDGTILEADFGDSSSDGLLHYMRVKGRAEFFLMSRFVLHEWQKVIRAVQ